MIHNSLVDLEILRSFFTECTLQKTNKHRLGLCNSPGRKPIASHDCAFHWSLHTQAWLVCHSHNMCLYSCIHTLSADSRLTSLPFVLQNTDCINEVIKTVNTNSWGKLLNSFQKLLPPTGIETVTSPMLRTIYWTGVSNKQSVHNISACKKRCVLRGRARLLFTLLLWFCTTCSPPLPKYFIKSKSIPNPIYLSTVCQWTLLHSSYFIECAILKTSHSDWRSNYHLVSVMMWQSSRWLTVWCVW